MWGRCVFLLYPWWFCVPFVVSLFSRRFRLFASTCDTFYCQLWFKVSNRGLVASFLFCITTLWCCVSGTCLTSLFFCDLLVFCHPTMLCFWWLWWLFKCHWMRDLHLFMLLWIHSIKFELFCKLVWFFWDSYKFIAILFALKMLLILSRKKSITSFSWYITASWHRNSYYTLFISV